mgnify:CR=1 FL=1
MVSTVQEENRKKEHEDSRHTSAGDNPVQHSAIEISTLVKESPYENFCETYVQVYIRV